MRVLALIGAVLLGAATPAAATLATTIAGPSGAYVPGITCHDNDPCDLNPTVDILQFQPGLGGTPLLPGFNFALSVSQAGPNLLDTSWNLSSFNDFGTGDGGTLEIIASFASFPVVGPAVLESALAGTCTVCTVSGTQWALTDGAAISGGIQGPFTGPAFASTIDTAFLAAGAVGIMEHLVVTLGPESITTGDFQSRVRQVPAPAAGLLLGAGLLLVGRVLRVRRP